MSSWKDRFANMMKQPEEEENMDDFEGYYDDEEPAEAAPEAAPEPQPPQPPQPANDQGQADGNNGDAAAPADDGKTHLVLFKPETFDKDVTTMADRFIKQDTLILNMEQTNKDVAKRIIDFLGGVAYAYNGNIKRVAEDTYIVMPSNIDLTGDEFSDEVESDNAYF